MQKMGIVLSLFIGLFTIGCAQPKTTTLSGYIFVKGSAPHSYVALEDKEHHVDYKIENAKAFHLAQRQREKVTMEVVLLKEAVGPGFPAVVHVVKID